MQIHPPYCVIVAPQALWPAMAGWLDRWAEREQRRTERENRAWLERKPAAPFTWKDAASCLVCAALATALPWPLWLALVACALLAGPGRRWWADDRRRRRATDTCLANDGVERK